MDLIEVDGSYGEGGGQILRSAIALSAISGKGVHIVDIRKNRPRPGLATQHIFSMALAAKMASAEISGLETCSTELTFIPGDIKEGRYAIDVGTAGSVTLVLQSVLPIAISAPGPVTIEVTGGTDVRWSPTYDYFKSVTLQALRMFGLDASIRLSSRGFFPKGGGKVTLEVRPSRLKGIDLIRPAVDGVSGVSCSSGLPPHVAKRQAEAAKFYLESRGVMVSDLSLDVRHDISTGSSITLHRGLIGFSALGERGVPAEKVGQHAASGIIKEFSTGAAVDEYLADQLMPFMAMASGSSSLTCPELSSHAVTNMWIVEKMTGRKFTVKKDKNVFIQCE